MSLNLTRSQSAINPLNKKKVFMRLYGLRLQYKSHTDIKCWFQHFCDIGIYMITLACLDRKFFF